MGNALYRKNGFELKHPKERKEEEDRGGIRGKVGASEEKTIGNWRFEEKRGPFEDDTQEEPEEKVQKSAEDKVPHHWHHPEHNKLRVNEFVELQQ